MEMTEILEIVLMVCIGIIGFFLKTLHGDVKKNVEDIGKLKGRVALIDQAANSKIDNLTQVTELQIQQLTQSVKELNDSVMHMNNNMKISNGIIAEYIKGKYDE